MVQLILREPAELAVAVLVTIKQALLLFLVTELLTPVVELEVIIMPPAPRSTMADPAS